MILLLLSCFLILFLYGTRTFGYWKKKGIKHDLPLPFFGTNLSQFLRLNSFAEIYTHTYFKYPNEKVVGFYRATRPVLIIKDPDLIKHVLNTDFYSYYKRGLSRNTDVEPMLKNLFHAEGDQWKLLRQRLTPAFTSGKLKQMFNLILECAEKLQALAFDIIDTNNGVYDVRELMARYTTEFIGSCGFGINMNSLNCENSEFRRLGQRMFRITPRTAFIIMLYEMFPELCDSLKLKAIERDIDDSVINLFDAIQKQRNYKPSGRNDFIDLLLELKAKGKIVGESIEATNDDGKIVQSEMLLDTLTMAAQVFVFFAAGFETSSSATSYTLHQLAFHPELQDKIYFQINEVLSKYNNKLTYEGIKELTYLEMAFKEGMRMFPSLGVLNRECTKRNTLPNIDLTLDPGVKIVIPVAAIQNDSKYYENPEQFNPNRFTSEECAKRHHYVYLPFGEGPRNCIGSRLGQLQSITGMASILHKFSLEPADITKRIPELDHTSGVVQSIKGGLPLKLVKRS